MARHTGRAIEDPAPRGPVARAFARVVAGPLSPFIIAAWVAAAALAAVYLPGFGGGQGSIAGLTPASSPAISAELESSRLFDLPVLSRVAVVQRDPDGLDPDTQRATVAAAVATDRSAGAAAEGAGAGSPAGAFPLINDRALVPRAREHGTTAITYLFFDPATSWAAQVQGAREYAAQDLRGAAVVGVTGSVPARVAQEDRIDARLTLVEVATVAVIALVLLLTFRSLIAPLLTLAVGGVAYVLASHLVTWAGGRYGVSPPPELDPLIVVLLLGIVTDYAIFYLTGFRARLEAGEPRARAARSTTAEYTPIIFTAGLTVAAGTLALVAARQPFFRDFGPGLALSVVVGVVVAVTLIPALLALVGGAMFWPRRPAVPAAPRHARTPEPPGGRSLRGRLAHLVTNRAAALVIAVVCVAVLLTAASGLRETRMGLGFITGLPAGDEARRAAEAAAEGFAPGVIAPTEVIVLRDGIAAQTAELARLQQELAGQPGVAGVAGPREQAAATAAAGPAVGGDAAGETAGGAAGETAGPTLATSRSGDAARYLVVFDADPLGSAGIERYDQLRAAMPGLLSEAGLGGAQVLYAGDTAIAEDTIASTLGDLGRVAIVVILLDFVLLALFLRAWFAPVYLIAASVLALAAALGLTTYAIQLVLGGGDLSYYVPFAASVLLISLGSDYTIFLVGRIWDERRRRPLRGAIETAVPHARRAISAAALALALSFAMLALVDLAAFRQLAFLLAAGVLIDSFFVRSLFVPALVALFGRQRIAQAEAATTAEAPAPDRRAA
jgi:RND superfamily putative drug exporter